MSAVLRRVVPLLASLALHGGVFLAVLLYTVLPALGFAALGGDGDFEGEDEVTDGQGGPADGETLEEYLARSQDDVAFGQPAAEIVGITIVPDYQPPPADPPPDALPEAAPLPAPEAAPAVAAVEPAPKPEADAPKADEGAPEAEAVAEAEAIPDASASEIAAVEKATADKAAAIRKELERGPVTIGGGKRPWTPKDADPNDGVTRVSRTGWKIERGLLDYYATHIPELMKLGSVRPHKGADGKVDGFRLRVKKGSLLKEAGLRSGDIVHSVNGIQVHDVISALDAYFKLRKSKHVELVVERKGKIVKLSYDLI